MRSLVLGLLVFTMTFSLQAEQNLDLAKLVPQDALLYFNIENLHDKNSSSSSLSRLFGDESVTAFINKITENFEKMSAENIDKEMGKIQSELKLSDEKIKEVKDLVKEGKLWESVKEVFEESLVVYVPAPADSIFDDVEKDLQIIMLADIDNSAGKFDFLLNLLESLVAEKIEFSSIEGNTFKVRKLVPKEIKEEYKKNALYISYSKNHLVVSNNLDTSISIFATVNEGGLKENVTAQDGYKKCMKNSPEKFSNSGYLNIEKILASIPEKAGQQPNNGGQGQPMGHVVTREHIMTSLGLSNVKSLGWYSFAEKDGTAISNSLVYAPGEKQGLVKLLCSSPAEMTVPAYYPKTLGIYEAVRMSPEVMLNSIIEMSTGINPAYSMIIDMSLEGVKQQHGLDIKDQLLKAFGTEHSFSMIYNSKPKDMSSVNPNMAPMLMGFDMAKSLLISAELKDSEMFKNAVTILQAIGAKANPMLANSFEEDYNGTKITIMGMSMPGFPVACYFINNNRLFFALSPETLKLIIDGYGDKGNGLAADPLFKEAENKIGAEKSVGITVMNEAAYFSWYSELLKQLVKIVISNEKAKTADVNAEIAAENNEAGQPAQPVEIKEHPLEKLIDFSLWPQSDVFKKHMGYSVVKIIPVEEGILMKGCSVPQPAGKAE
ncbi:MAG: hypothetical protein ACYTFY_04155 [Planctomycetota bacterium]|jgi:hypothetical protein